MPVHSTIEAADCPAAEQLLLTIGRSGVLSCRAIASGELAKLLRLLGPPSERQRSDTAVSLRARLKGLRSAVDPTIDVVRIGDGHLNWPILEQRSDLITALPRPCGTLAHPKTAVRLLRTAIGMNSKQAAPEHSRASGRVHIERIPDSIENHTGRRAIPEMANLVHARRHGTVSSAVVRGATSSVHSKRAKLIPAVVPDFESPLDCRKSARAPEDAFANVFQPSYHDTCLPFRYGAHRTTTKAGVNHRSS